MTLNSFYGDFELFRDFLNAELLTFDHKSDGNLEYIYEGHKTTNPFKVYRLYFEIDLEEYKGEINKEIVENLIYEECAEYMV